MKLPEFDSPPKAIAIDLDGTLLDSQGRLSERNDKAIEKCIAQGIPVVIATSRPARIVNRIFPQDLAARCSFVIMSGAIAKGNPPLSGYFKESLPEGLARRIIDLALKFDPGIRITVELDGYEFGANWTADAATLWQKNSATPDMVFSVEDALLRQPCKVALSSLGTDVLKLGDEFVKSFGGAISVVPALLGFTMLNITSGQASKPSALRRLLTPRGISLQDMIAFGDDIPDVEMLKECGVSVAVANAFPEVRSVCAYHTASNDEDGVAIVLEQMLARIGK
ncbi:MAG: HAD family hydrolase [Chloroflexi bacterium]|nr:HAD family hydrolase [Chloroflexota bacterium]